MATGVYKKSKKHRENLSKALKEYWSDETRREEWTNKIQEGINDYWESKPDDEFILGRRIRQKVDGKRDRAGYAAYQNEYQKKFRRRTSSDIMRGCDRNELGKQTSTMICGIILRNGEKHNEQREIREITE